MKCCCSPFPHSTVPCCALLFIVTGQPQHSLYFIHIHVKKSRQFIHTVLDLLVFQKFFDPCLQVTYFLHKDIIPLLLVCLDRKSVV